MDNCCNNKSGELARLRERQGRVLWAVLVVNAVMFLLEFSYGWVARSSALLADSLDMLGDSAVYAFSLYVLHKSERAKAIAASLKGSIMLIFGLGVFVETLGKVFRSTVPHAETMGIIGFVALAANAVCLYLLVRHKNDDVNLRSTWLCSRNDIISNVGVLVAAAGVAMTNSKWPDVLIGMIIAVLFLHSAIGTFRDAWRVGRVSTASI